MAEAVVDLLEPVEIEEQHRERVLRPLRAGQRLVEAIAEESAVRQARQAVVERLQRQLLLQAHPLGDVATVEDDAADLPVGAEVGDVRLEMPPLRELVHHPEDDLVRLAVRVRGAHRSQVVRMHEAREPLAEEILLRTAEHVRDGPADVAAPACAEDEHEVGGRGDEASEVGGLPPGRGDEPESEEQRGEQPGGAEQNLEHDQPRDAPVVAGADRPRCVQRDVRGQGREHAQPLDRIACRQPLVRRQLDAGGGASGKDCGACPGQVGDEPLLLLELCANGPALRPRQRGLVVVAVDRGGDSTVEQRVRTAGEQPAGPARISPRAASLEENLLDVALREGPLARCHLEHRRTVPRARGCPDRDRHAQRREEREGQEDRDDGPPPPFLERPEGVPAAHRYCTTNSVCMPPR